MRIFIIALFVLLSAVAPSRACVPEFCVKGTRLCAAKNVQYFAVIMSGATYSINGSSITLTVQNGSSTIGPMMPSSVTPLPNGDYEYRYNLTTFNIPQQCYSADLQSVSQPVNSASITICPNCG